MVKHRQPLLSYAEISLSLPAPRSLWLAPSAETWRTRYLSKANGHVPSLRKLLQDDAAILCLPQSVDKNIARSAYLHGLAAQIWEYSQQAMLLGESSDTCSQLSLQMRQKTL
jgi:hypothetical protein